MKPLRILAAAVAACAISTECRAQLPSLSQPPWTGFYAGYGDRKFRIGVSSVGTFSLIPLDSKGSPISSMQWITINPGIEETMPDGRVTMRQIKPESLKAEGPPTDKLEEIVITGASTGDAQFRMFFEQKRGIIYIGGEVTDPGTLTKNPVRFALRMRFRDFYPHEKTEDKRAERAFEKKVSGERIDLRWTDGTRRRHSFDEAVDFTKDEFNGPGVASLDFAPTVHRGRRYILTASPETVLTFWNSSPSPLFNGFSVNWTSEKAAEKDKARLALEIR